MGNVRNQFLATVAGNFEMKMGFLVVILLTNYAFILDMQQIYAQSPMQ